MARVYIEEMRQRLGLEANDPSRDEFIENMTPMNRLKLICGWKLGHSSWAETVLNWAREAGFKISPDEGEP